MNIKNKFKKALKYLKHRERLLPVINESIAFYENNEKVTWGSITEEEEVGVRAAVSYAATHKGPIIEIGALFGNTTTLLATLKQSHVELITVENFSWNPFQLTQDEHRQFTMRSLRYLLEHASTEIYDGSSEAFYSANEDLNPSMVFIDAGHDYDSVKKDIEWAVARKCPVISGHDYTELYPDVVRAVDEAFANEVELYGSVWVHRRGES